LLNVQSLLIGAALLVALVAFLRARRVARRLERLTESYWELRYEYGQLRARVTRLEPPATSAEAPGPTGMTGPHQQARPTGTTNFVPLSSLKR
jgi:type II secretory pathway component PulJ